MGDEEVLGVEADCYRLNHPTNGLAVVATGDRVEAWVVCTAAYRRTFAVFGGDKLRVAELYWRSATSCSARGRDGDRLSSRELRAVAKRDDGAAPNR